jgi:hypothetical protein
MNALRQIALVFSLILVLFSLSIMLVERTITAEAWAMLLLAPVPVGFAVTSGNEAANEVTQIVDWQEEPEFEKDKSVGEPSEAGFDVPVL